ncbi:MoxR family ATPase [Rubellicoccus peritrichatus]|uniref:MoxR family ATPase n=1 Tax=Rubellicoccus peritrichatus TaxID=3080537 RepID=A0AAQ3LGR9_9BACT|nr:MoxR family ATPase [Puniceicoccus sp. CR14]WOO43600.1 MoxR family ATPase [Puniceicoccus sp. CR14]
MTIIGENQTCPPELEKLQEAVTEVSGWIPAILDEMQGMVVGQQYLIQRLIIGLLCNGHVLLEGVPGLAKTTTINALAGCFQAKFSRIQFTPDLLPSDIVGTLIYNPQEHTYFTKKGPIFANLLLADEINRAPAKVQSALLEAMQERQVTLGDETFKLPEPFLVLATQNPVEQEGTYPLPEAQVDRFMLKVTVDYGSDEEELRILELMASTKPKAKVNPVMNMETLLQLRELTDQIYLDDNIKRYIVALVSATRKPENLDPKLAGLIRYGASPRATINLTLAARAHAFMEGRAFVTPIDVRSIAFDVLSHRILRTYEADAEGITSSQIVEWILEKVPVP